MKLFINYDIKEKNYLSILQYYLRKNGFTASASAMTLSAGELVAKATVAKADGILLINEASFKKCIDGSFSSFRGSYLAYSIPTIVGGPLQHLVTVNHGPFLLETDLNKFYELKKHPPERFSYTLLDETHLFSSAFQELSSAILISYDIETVTLTKEGKIIFEKETDTEEVGDTLITCCSWSCLLPSSEIKTFVLPIIDFQTPHWTSVAYQKVISFFRAVNDLDVPKVMHNGMYDVTHSIIYRAFPKNWTLDTMAMAWSQYSSLPKSLDFVASITLPDYKQWKHEAETSKKERNISAYWRYNAKDAYTTLRIALHYLQYLPAYARRTYATQFKLVYPFLYCGLEGFRVDNNERERLRSDRIEKIEHAKTTLQKMVKNTDFNPGSWQQVQYYIYKVLKAKDPHVGYRKLANGRKERITMGTDEKNLLAVSRENPLANLLIKEILSYRENVKAVSTYFDFLQKNGRLLYSINPFGTDSGRASSSASALWCGTQIQNIPMYAKTMLVPDPGFILCEPDNSQSEARCTAYLAEEPNFIEALETPGKDFYRTLGTLLFEIPYEDVTTEFRNDVLKRINHGVSYMMKEQTFIENAGIERLKFAASVLGVTIVETPKNKNEATLKQFAGMLLEKYHQPFPKLRRWYQAVKDEIASTHQLKSPLGWTRYFFGDINKNYQIFSSAVAHGPQNLSVNILNIGVWKNYLLMKENPKDFRIKAQIHDSMPFQYRKGREDLRNTAIANFENPIIVNGRTLRIPVDFKEGLTWGTMKKGG